MQSLLMVVGFMLAWSPYAIVCMSSALGYQALTHPTIALAPSLFAKSSFIWNPFIYIGLNRQVGNCVLSQGMNVLEWDMRFKPNQQL